MRFFLLSLFCILSLGAFADSCISFENKTHDFGLIKEKGGAVSHEFVFTNTGDTPLVIIKAKADCGCTRPTIPLEPIAPGESATIKVKFLPDGRPGEFIKTIRVTTNDPKHKKVRLKISGSVIPEN